MMELDSSDIVQMAAEGKKATPILRPKICSGLGRPSPSSMRSRTPDLDFIIISSCSQQRSAGVECNTSYRSYQECKNK